jgi:hypothetical protein
MTTTILETPTITPVPDKPAELDEVGKVLMRAAEIVRKRWTQGTFFDHAGNVCVAGALNEASTGSALHHRPELWAEVAKRWGVDDVGQYNDAPGRTANEVAEALERAAIGV